MACPPVWMTLFQFSYLNIDYTLFDYMAWFWLADFCVAYTAPPSPNTPHTCDDVKVKTFWYQSAVYLHFKTFWYIWHLFVYIIKRFASISQWKYLFVYITKRFASISQWKYLFVYIIKRFLQVFHHGQKCTQKVLEWNLWPLVWTRGQKYAQ